MTGPAFDGLVPWAAPYWLGSFLAALSLPVCLFTFFEGHLVSLCGKVSLCGTTGKMFEKIIASREVIRFVR
jgi:hypothetical protein